MLCQKLEPLLKKNSIRKPISVPKRVGITLIKLGSCGELRSVAREFGVARSTACKIINEVCLAICKTFPIEFPTGEKLQEVADGFIAKGGLPGCCGALDGSFIRIKAPIDNAKDFYCRKQCYAILLQAVVDSSTSFINVTVGWPGSVHDARVFRNSKLYRAGETNQLFLPATISVQNTQSRPFIVADQAYPALTWLKKPYGRILNNNMKLFNKSLSKGRIVVELAFGQLKGRWRCLLKENDCNIDHLKIQVLACCILHNFCNVEEDEYLEDWNVPESEILLNS